MYGFIQDVPANEEMYGQIRSRLGDQPPKGLVAHVVLTRDGGLRYVDVWETQADWERFRDEEVEPAVDAVLSAIGPSPRPLARPHRGGHDRRRLAG